MRDGEFDLKSAHAQGCAVFHSRYPVKRIQPRLDKMMEFGTLAAANLGPYIRTRYGIL